MADESTSTEHRADGPQSDSPWSPSAAPGWQVPPPPTSGIPSGRRGWTGPRIAILIIGSVLALVSLALLGFGGAATWLQTHRSGGYVDSGSQNLATAGYALASERVDLGNGRSGLIGTLRVRATPQQTARPVFVGIAPADQVDRYLAGVQYTSVDNVFTLGSGQNVTHNGGAPTTPPALARIWTVQSSGLGTQTVVWPAKSGQWSVVVMNAAASSGVSVHTDLGATLPPLPWVALGLVVGGLLLLVGSAALIIVPIHRAIRRE